MYVEEISKLSIKSILHLYNVRSYNFMCSMQLLSDMRNSDSYIQSVCLLK